MPRQRARTRRAARRAGALGWQADRGRSPLRWRSRRAPCCAGSASPGGRRPGRAAGAGRPPEAARQRSAGRRPRPTRRTRRGADGRASPRRACRPPRGALRRGRSVRVVRAGDATRGGGPLQPTGTTRIGRTISTADGPSASSDRQGDTGDDPGQRGAEQAVGGAQLGKRRRRAGRGRRSRRGSVSVEGDHHGAPSGLLRPRRDKGATRGRLVVPATPFIAFPGHAGRWWPLLGWRLVARSRGVDVPCVVIPTSAPRRGTPGRPHARHDGQQ